jgi:membrane protease YdiL (CAAX protease family)
LLKQQFDEVPWTAKQTFNGTFFTLLPWLMLSAGISLLNTSTPTSSKALSPQVDVINAIVTFVFSVLVEGAFLIAPYLYARRASASQDADQRSIADLLGFRRFNFARALPWLILLFLSFLLVNFLYELLITTFHLNIQTNDQRLLEEGRSAPITTYVTLFAAVFVAPFCEEVFFRSFVFMGLRNGMSLVWAIVLSALIFGAAHGDPGSFPVLFCIGLALAFMRWYTRSIWPGFILHAMNNGLSAILLVLAMHGTNVNF